MSDADARAEYQRKNLKVGLQYVAFEKSAFVSKVTNDPAAIKDFFNKNRHLFNVPEKRRYDLIAGSVVDYIQGAQVSDAQLQKEYQEEIDSFRTPERVRVRHILIKTQGKPKEERPVSPRQGRTNSETAPRRCQLRRFGEEVFRRSRLGRKRRRVGLGHPRTDGRRILKSVFRLSRRIERDC